MKDSPSLRKRIGQLCLAAFTALAGVGVTGCPGLTHIPMVMYGPPAAAKIHGTVKQSDGTAIKGINVTVSMVVVQNNETALRPYAQATTADDGSYSLRAPTGEKLEVDAVDVDGTQNGGDFATGTKSINALTTGQSAEADFTLTPKE